MSHGAGKIFSHMCLNTNRVMAGEGVKAQLQPFLFLYVAVRWCGGRRGAVEETLQTIFSYASSLGQYSTLFMNSTIEREGRYPFLNHFSLEYVF